MCLSVVAKILEIIDQNDAQVDINGVRKKIIIALLADQIKVGDWVLVHTGFAVAIIDEKKALEILEAYEQIGSVPGV